MLDEPGKMTDCADGFEIKVNDFSKVTEDQYIDVDYTETSTSGSDYTSKTLDYKITIYKPKTGSPRTQSTTVAKCNGIQQEEEGSFTIHEGKKSASSSGSSDTDSDDETDPVIGDVEIYDVASNTEITDFTTVSEKTIKIQFKVIDSGNNLAGGKMVYTIDEEDYTKSIRNKTDDDIYSFTTTMPIKLNEEDVIIKLIVEDDAENPSDEEEITMIVQP